MKNIKMFVAVAFIGILISNFAFAEDLKKAESFSLKDYNGKEVKLSDFKSSKAIVVMFISTQCPVSNAYNERMAGLYNEYKNRGVEILGINSNKQEGIDEIKKHSKEHSFGFSVLKDEKNIVADKFGASFTPEIYVLNGNMDILYHGRIDDSRKTEDVKSNDLKNALNEILNGKSVTVNSTKAFGCSIKRVNS
jgi:peroxiredoxin